jgi:beta-glucosidase
VDERSGDARVDELLGQLTLDEKAALCHGRDLWTIDGCERVGIPSWTVSDGPIGIRGRHATRTACFPSASAIAATFDLDLVEEVGRAIALEAKAKNVQMALGPTVNLHRHPITGRHFECYSEDPELTAQVGVAYIRGVQQEGVGACIKHFVANDQEHERFTYSADVEDRTLRELYLRPFEDAVADAEVWGVMGAYNFVNGIQACAHAELLQEILKQEWGFPGLVVSDWTALKEGVGPGRNGLDLEMPGPGAYFGDGKLADLVRAGEVPESEVDDKARRILRFLDWCGALDGTESTEAELDTPEQRAVARRTAAASLVLLANDGVLPLDRAGLSTVAVIGPNAEDTAALGGGSATVNPYYTVSILDGLREALGPDVTVVHEPGCTIRRAVEFIPDELLTDDRFTIDVLVDDEVVVTHRNQGARGILGAQQWEGVEPPLLLRGRGTFVPAESGVWRLAGGGLHKLKLWIDGDPEAGDEPTTDNSLPGAINAGLANHAAITERTLEAGQPVALAFEYEVLPSQPLALYTLGAGLVGDEAGGEAGLAAAETAARDADVVVVVVGSNDEWESEGADRADLVLPGEQDELVRRVAAANPRTVVVHNSGSPMTMPWADDVAAILQAWYPGQEGGNAVADVLVGDVDPSGRMPTTWPKRIEDTPAFPWYPGTDGQAKYGEGLLLGHRWYLAHEIEPQWWFGHGLSYTSVEWGETQAEVRPPDEGDLASRVVVTVGLTNTGERDGAEVVQVYVERPDGPVRVLAGFAKVPLAAGAAGAAEILLSEAAFRYWDVAARRWVVDPGEYRVVVARSAADVVATHQVAIEVTP